MSHRWWDQSPAAITVAVPEIAPSGLICTSTRGPHVLSSFPRPGSKASGSLTHLGPHRLPPSPGQERERSLCGKLQNKGTNCLDFGGSRSAFKAQPSDFTGGVTSLSLSSEGADEMGRQALHPAQGTRGCHQMASPIAVVFARVFICCGLEPQRKQESWGPCSGVCWVWCLVPCHPILVVRKGPGCPGMKQGHPLPFKEPPRNPPWSQVPVQRKLQSPHPPPLPWGFSAHPSLLGQRPSPSGRVGCGARGRGAWGVGCSAVAHTCQLHTRPAGGLPTSRKETNDLVSSTRVDAHLKEMIPSSHLTVIFQLIVI